MVDKSILVVDDEPLARLRLLRLLEKCEGFTVCAEAENGRLAIEQVERHNPDIVLLDIRMPGICGLTVARHLSQQASPPAVIFCTAYGEHALEAFDFNATAYLLKPVKLERLHDVLSRACKLTKAQLNSLGQEECRRHISVKRAHGVELVAVTDICYFVADQKYVTLGYEHGEALIDGSLKELEAEFGDLFHRVHRNALVSLAHIDALERSEQGQYQLRLRGVELRPQVSRRHLASLRKLLQTL
ncbi:LytTR family two component transcriptional regulator [Sinobacterium caligoides]|uniref:LytTR family two component transcriptional regulator n=1 Tax=Sinobacterium caligoides TaxID=933926 RepID=A0A3N2DQC1_9GAMM|nr:LytTR family DNA-binding domain-containing protein [Sinobacterium caligoides]ROS01993.1 LytTR family two component transcriptional regulator [Sinobacterium caligoides]